MRLLSTETKTSMDNQYGIFFLNTMLLSSSAASEEFVDQKRTVINSLYSSSLMLPPAQRQSLVDIWGRPRIPRWDLRNDTDEKRLVDQDALLRGDLDYASLLGVSVQGLRTLERDDLVYEFSTTSAYFDLDCKMVTPSAHLDDVNKYLPVDRFNASSLEEKSPTSITSPFDIKSPYDIKKFMAQLDIPGNFSQKDFMEWRQKKDPEPMFLIYISRARFEKGTTAEKYNSHVAIFNCSMIPVQVETDMHCGGHPISCNPYRQRRAYSHPPSTRDWPPNWSTDDITDALGIWPLATGPTDFARASPTDNYVAGDDFPYLGQDIRVWDSTDMAKFSSRLTTAFNTFWQASFTPFKATNAGLLDTVERNSTTGLLDNGVVETSGMELRTRTVYRANVAWASILLLTTLVLEGLAIASIIFEQVVIAPDVLGYASTMTKDNIYTPMPESGSMLNGTERARLLKDMRVQIADVRPDDEIGYIAFKTVGAGANWSLLSKKRLYR